MKKAKFFDRRIDETSALIVDLDKRAKDLPESHRILFAEALEELRTSLEELQVAGEELSQQSDELSSARLAAEEERQRYLELFAYAPDAYLVTDPMGVIVEANERAGVLFKVIAASLIKKPMVLFIEKADRKAFFAQLARLSESGGIANWEIYFQSRKGKPFPAQVDITTVRGPKSRLLGFRWLIRDATEAKKREQLARLASFPELNPEPVMEVDSAGHVYYMNPAARKAFRGLPEAGAGHPWLAGIEKAGTRFAGSRKKSISREIQVNGTWFLQTICPVGEKDRFRIYGHDITERVRVEEALLVNRAELEERVRNRTAELARSKELLERVFASVDLSIAYLGLDFRFIRVNRAFADEFGGTPESYAGKDCFAVFPGKETEAIFRKVLATGEPFTSLESPFPNPPDAGPLMSFWDWSLQPVTTEKGREGLVLSLVNVTGRVKAEEERRRLSTAVEQSSEAIVITDPLDRILYVNLTFMTFHGLSRRDVLGRTYREVLGLDNEEESLKQGIRDALAEGEVWKGRLTRAIGSEANGKLDVTISPVHDGSGRLVNFAILERDVTREHKLEAYVRQMQKMDALGTLAGGIAHDFNNILVPILINAEVALLEAPKEGASANSLNLVIEAANRGRELVKQIISFSRPHEKRRSLVEMSEVVKEAVKFLKSSIPKSITIRENIGPGPAIVRADPTQIHQVIMNLASNAVHALREKGGWLDIGLSVVVIGPETAALNSQLKPGPYVRLTVEDSGGGMTHAVQERIFDPFFTTKAPGEGAGMGLTVAQGIVKSHGGAIMVATRPGEGTRFDIYFPERKGDVTAAAPEAGLARAGKGHILFIDDEDMLVRTVPIMLERLGYKTQAVSDPVEALALFREDPGAFDLVITDVTMPGMTGEKLAREMLRVRPGLPIILSTGFNETVREDEVRAMGIRDFIMKPYSSSEIAEKIRAAMKES